MIRLIPSRRTTLTAGIVAGLMLATSCSSETESFGSDSGGADDMSVSIAVVAGWDEDIAATYLWKELLEQEGYKVTVQDLDVASSFTGVANGQVDLYLDAWLPTTHETYWDQFGDDLAVVSSWYEPADLNLAVPQYVDDVNSIADLQGRASEFDDLIVGIEAGAGLMRLTRENVMPTYGLDDYDLVEGSSPAMLAALDKAIQDEQPIVVTLWRPHWAFTKYDIKALEDPDGAFGDPDTLQAIAGPDFADQNPEVAEWLSNFKLTSEQLGSLELLIQQKGQGNEQEAAKEWISQNEDVVDSWLS